MDRLNRLRGLLSENKLPAALISKPENMRYLTGYTGEGCVLVTLDKAFILTDFRYTEQAVRQSPDCECIMTTFENKPADIAARLLKERGYVKLAVEADYLTVTTFREYKSAMSGIELDMLNRLPEKLRRVKDENEIARVNKAAEIACQAFDHILGYIKPGLTEKQVQLELDYTMLRLGADKLGFDTIACAGPNGSLPHATPSDRPIQKGELLTLDFGAEYQGYISDMTRTVAIGEVSNELKDIYDTTLKAQLAALDAIKPGVRCVDIDKIARDIIDEKYPGAFGHSLGHGVGLLVHEEPNFSRLSTAITEPGHVMTVEPGIYIEGLGGCRIEDMVIITEEGYTNPITAPKQLIIL